MVLCERNRTMIEIKSYQVFLAFTSDLKEEEKIFRQVLNSYSKEIRYESYIEFRPVTYNDMPSRGLTERLQDCINRELLEQSDYFIFVVNDHLGSPSGKIDNITGIQKTGITEEWEVVQRLLQEKNMEENIACFFKKIDKEKLEKPDVKKVIEFRGEAVSRVYCKEYENSSKLRKELKICLKNWKQGLRPSSITVTHTSLEGDRSDV